MATKEEIDLYRAVDDMRRLSASGQTYTLKFRKWDRQRQQGGDLVTIPAARLRPKASDEQVDQASQKLFFTDTDTGRALVCWTILITAFDGHPTILP